MTDFTWNQEGDEYLPLIGDLHVVHWGHVNEVTTFLIVSHPRVGSSLSGGRRDWTCECLIQHADGNAELGENCDVTEYKESGRSYGFTILRKGEVLIDVPPPSEKL